MRKFLLLLIFLGTSHACSFAATAPWGKLAKNSDEWYGSPEGRRTAENILSWQSDLGGWPKNLDTTERPFSGDRKTIKGTFDNSATTGELRFLARAFEVTKDERYREAFLKGVRHILQAQYPTGGWPQLYPPGPQYHRHITFNDDAMIHLMDFLREVANAPAYRFVDDSLRKRAVDSFQAGIECILRCQVRVAGHPTVWCAQHDEIDYAPRPGRTFELVSLSGAESARILGLLMSLDQPSREVTRAIEGGVAWWPIWSLRNCLAWSRDCAPSSHRSERRINVPSRRFYGSTFKGNGRFLQECMVQW